MIKELIVKVVQGENLSEDEMATAMEEIMTGNAIDAQIGAFITALRLKGETVDEITGAAVHALNDVGGDRIEHLARRDHGVDRQCFDLDPPIRSFGDIGGEALESLLIHRARLPESLPLPVVVGGAGRRRKSDHDGCERQAMPEAASCQHAMPPSVFWLSRPLFETAVGIAIENGFLSFHHQGILRE